MPKRPKALALEAQWKVWKANSFIDVLKYGNFNPYFYECICRHFIEQCTWDSMCLETCVHRHMIAGEDEVWLILTSYD